MITIRKFKRIVFIFLITVFFLAVAMLGTLSVDTFIGHAYYDQFINKSKIVLERWNITKDILPDFIIGHHTITTSPRPKINISTCPEKSPFLRGAYNISFEPVKRETLEKRFPWMQDGGHLEPTDCKARQRVAIIIPYRNREEHLHILLSNLLPLLRRQQSDATVFAIEQEPPTTFNRGMLLNIGFIEALKLNNYTCFITHDVDKIPEYDNNLYRCNEFSPKHMCYRQQDRYKLPYANWVGGVVSMKTEHYIRTNGFSNCYFGWGGEDDDFGNRMRKMRLNPIRDQKYGRYKSIKHIRDHGNEENSYKIKLYRLRGNKQHEEGLNTMNYTVTGTKITKLYTKITVKFDRKGALNCPAFVYDIR